MPEAHEFVTGMPHKCNKIEEKGRPWPVYKAIHSRKMHYLNQIQSYLPGGVEDNAAWYLGTLWPDTWEKNARGGKPLSQENLEKLKQYGLVTNNNKDLLKAILTLHDGEAKVVRHLGWEPVPDGVDVHDPGFWHYQYVTNFKNRQWLYHRWRDGDKSKLSDGDIEKIFKEEGKNRTLVLRAANSNDSRGYRWEIRVGTYITLAELFFFAGEWLACHHIYRMYLSLDVYIQPKMHSQSTSERAIKKQNAKVLHFKETGYWGLPPARGRQW